MSEPIRFLLDEHVARAVGVGLLKRGIEATMLFEVGMLGAADEEILEYALAHGYVLFSHDDDFLALHAAGTRHAGMVFAPRRAGIGEVVRHLALIHAVLDSDGMHGQVEFLS